MSEELTFGLPQEYIQSLQQRNYPYKVQTTTIPSPKATEEDKKLLADKGLDWLKFNHYWGVVDRLRSSGEIE